MLFGRLPWLDYIRWQLWSGCFASPVIASFVHYTRFTLLECLAHPWMARQILWSVINKLSESEKTVKYEKPIKALIIDMAISRTSSWPFDSYHGEKGWFYGPVISVSLSLILVVVWSQGRAILCSFFFFFWRLVNLQPCIHLPLVHQFGCVGAVDELLNLPCSSQVSSQYWFLKLKSKAWNNF